MSLKTLLERRRELVGAWQQIFATAQNDGDRALTDDERDRVQRLRDDVTAVDADIAEQRASQAERPPLLGLRDTDGPDGGSSTSTPSSMPRARGRTFREMFGEPKGLGGFESGAEFFQAVGRSDREYFPALKGIQTGGVGSEGGYSVPEVLAAGLLDASLESEIVRPRADV